MSGRAPLVSELCGFRQSRSGLALAPNISLKLKWKTVSIVRPIWLAYTTVETISFGPGVTIGLRSAISHLRVNVCRRDHGGV